MPLTASNSNQLLQSLPMEGDGKSFVAYRLPGQQKAHVLIGDAMETHTLADVLGKDGFAFLPAANSHQAKPYIILPDQRFELGHFDTIQFPHLNWPLMGTEPYVASEREYLAQAESIIQAIQAGKLEKAILSRIKKTSTQNLNLWESFRKLCAAYPSVMVYWVSIPGVGTWVGATPETLLRLENGLAQTVALAGTQSAHGNDLENTAWGDKERQEQQIVADNIKALIAEHYPAIKVDTVGPNTVSTGALLHLKTTFNWRMPNDLSATEAFINDLHPTPAIAGQPREAALDLIAETEPHDRAYYTGLLGPVGGHDFTHLFVNLRCMQVFQNYLALYLGGGITAASNPSAEWQETELKAGTLLKVL